MFLTIAAICITAVSFLLGYYLGFHLLYAYLLSVNLVTFLMYGSDKYRAVNHRPRIPEIVLHLLALAGGSLGALLAQLIFRHKTRKWSFKIIFIIIVIVQLLIIAGVIYVRHTEGISG